jgi:5-methylthioadenosine/S-adenosylhomocysteine deaminase
MSILIKNASYVVTQNYKRDILKNYDILIEGNKITNIGKNLKCKAEEIIDGKGKVILPGLINLHTHSPMTLFRGYADDMELFEWLEKKIWPTESKLTGKDCYYGALVACLEMVRGGITCFLDMYNFLDDVAKASKEIGVRSFLAWAIMDKEITTQKGDPVKNCEHFIRRWKGDSLVTPAAGPHAIYTCSPENLKRVKQLAEKYNVLVHMHLSETRDEVKRCINKYDKWPAEHLETLDFLSPNLILSHCIWLTEKEIELLRVNQVKVAHCPISNLKLGSGLAPVYEMSRKGIMIGLGTDSVASNNTLNIFEEMKISALLQKYRYYDTRAIPAQEALDMATINGARCLGIDDKLGSIEKEKLADIIILNLRKPHLYPLHNIISHIVYAANAQDVETTIVNGKIIMKDRDILAIDEDEVLEKSQEIALDLIRRNNS